MILTLGWSLLYCIDIQYFVLVRFCYHKCIPNLWIR